MSGRGTDPIANVEALGETDLLRLLRQSDPRAYHVLVRRHNRRLYRVARAVLGDDREAEDVVQETYLRALTHLARFRGRSGLSTWLTRIAINEARDRLRRRSVHAEPAVFDDEKHVADDVEIVPFSSGARTIDPERALAQREILRLLERAIDDLPEPFRVVFVMRIVEEMSVDETAGILGVPDTTVRTRLHRARARLRQVINAEVGTAMMHVFPFADMRCEQTTTVILQRLGRGSPLAE